MAAAADLFSLLTDEKRIPSWTRASAQSKAEAGGEYALFGGGVKGKYVSLTPPKTIVQSWALQSPTWPSGHSATLTTTLEESNDSTKMKLSLDGVPTGLEDEIRRNLDGYYIHGLKAIGYVQLVPSHPSSYVTSRPNRTLPSNKKPSDNWTPYVAVAMIIMTLVAALTIPLLSPSS
jgi:activator of HSP90 ATPase